MSTDNQNKGQRCLNVFAFACDELQVHVLHLSRDYDLDARENRAGANPINKIFPLKKTRIVIDFLKI